MKKNQGFTLLELLISMFVLSIIVLAFSTISISSIKGNSKNNNDIVAMNIAQGEIENVISQMKTYKNFTPISLTSVEGKEILLNKINTFLVDKNNNMYNVDLEIKKVDNGKEIYPGLYEVKVKVALKEKNEYLSKKSTELITQVILNN